MKTCYGGYCYTHVDDREFNNVLSSPISPFLVGIALVVALAIGANLLSDPAITNYLTSGFINDFPNSDYIIP